MASRTPIESGATDSPGSQRTGVSEVTATIACDSTRGRTHVRRQPADFSLMRSSTAFGMVVSKSRSLAQVGVIVMTTISS